MSDYQKYVTNNRTTDNSRMCEAQMCLSMSSAYYGHKQSVQVNNMEITFLIEICAYEFIYLQKFQIRWII
jgi:hypothetical protein